MLHISFLVRDNCSSCPSNMHPECWCKDDPFPIMSLGNTSLFHKVSHICHHHHVKSCIVHSLSKEFYAHPSKAVSASDGLMMHYFQFSFHPCYNSYPREIPLKHLQKCWVWKGTKSTQYPTWTLNMFCLMQV